MTLCTFLSNPSSRLFRQLLFIVIFYSIAGPASAANRKFNLHIKNGTSTQQLLQVIPGNCWEGTPRYGRFIVDSGGIKTILIARVQLNHCAGEQGRVQLRIGNFIVDFDFNNGGGLQLSRSLSNGFHGVLSEKSPVDGSYTYTFLPIEQRLKHPVDQRLTRPRNPITTHTGEWAYSANNSNTLNYLNLRFAKNGFAGNLYESCVFQPLYHPQHVQRLADKNGKAYFMVTQSRAYRGSMYLIESYPGVLDEETGAINTSSGALAGKIIWEKIFSGDGFIGNWNHPGKMSLIDGILVVAAQNWSEGGYFYTKAGLAAEAVRVCNGDIPMTKVTPWTTNAYKVGYSEDAVLFYDVRDPSAPQYWGKMTAAQLEVPESEEQNGPWILPGTSTAKNDRMISVVSLWRTKEGKYALNAGGRRNGENHYATWETNAISPNISDWTKRLNYEYTSGEYGDDFESYQATPESDGILRNFQFNMGDSPGAGDNDSFVFATIPSERENPVAAQKWNIGFDDDHTWIAASHHANRKGVPLVYTVLNQDMDDTVLLQVYDTRNTLALPHPDRVVINTNDYGPGSLREALGYGGKITFDSSLDGATLKLYGGPLVVGLYDVEIDASNLPNGFTLSGAGRDRVLHVTIGNKAVLTGLTIEGGFAERQALGPGVNDNHRALGGGGILNEGTLELNESTVAGNFSAFDGGGIANYGRLSVYNSTIAENVSGFDIFKPAPTLSGGGAGISNYGFALLVHTTVASNNDFDVSKLISGIKNNGGVLFIDNSIIASNGPGNIAISGVYSTSGANVVNIQGGELHNGELPIEVPNLTLQPLGNYGGPTPTMPPDRRISQVINGALPTPYSAPINNRDQRGALRGADDGFDIGAVEMQIELVVSSASASGPGSLAEAIAFADDRGTITFSPELDGATIRLSGTPLTISKKLTINALLSNGITISGDVTGNGPSVDDSRIFNVSGSDAALALFGLTLTGGKDTLGGAVYVDDRAALATYFTTFSNNSAISGGAIAIVNATLLMNGSTISGNSASKHGGGIYTAKNYNNNLKIDIHSSTLAHNSAAQGGGAIWNRASNLILEHSTVANNSAGLSHNGGGIYLYGGSATIAFSIIADNVTDSGAGPDIYKVPESIDTIVNSYTLLGKNDTVESDFPASNESEFGFLVNIDPMLGTLSDNGGYVATIPLLWGSPAVDAVPIDAVPDTCNCSQDARGISRPQGSGLDIGAFELQWTDTDGDGVADDVDAFPLDPQESVDTDNDGIGNNADTDDDGDGVADDVDAFPLDAQESVDTDNDGIGNNADTDDDGDGVADDVDTFPLDAQESVDTDNDGIGNNADTDDDGDGVADDVDTFPLDAQESVDTDNDGIGNNADTDDDGDGVLDEDDAFPLNAQESLDTDNDGIGNNADTDDDGDGVADVSDAFPLNAQESVDTDNDGIGNNADTDDDGDGVADDVDTFPLDPQESVDTDNDGIGNNADTDDDGDGVADVSDAFPLNAQESVDTDNDGIGNNADTDDDGDGVADDVDTFPLDAQESVDTDNDGIGNNADTDDDGDGVADDVDAFPLDAQESVDTDNDGIGNNADTDDDGDGVADVSDAFPLDAQESVDTDNDGIGNNADTDDDGDGVADDVDTFPLDPQESVDTDNDGIGNNADTDDDGDGVLDEDDAYPLDPSKSQDNPSNVKNDSNGDGNADILWRNSQDGRNWLWTMNGGSIIRSAGINVIAEQAWQIVGRGDFDGDGKSDILWRNSNTGRNYIYLMDGHSIKQQGQLNYVNDTNWKVAEVADVDGDGKDDVIWRHATQGRTWIYLMNGMTTKASQGSLTVADLNWEIVASGDVNGDDKADVIWRHKTRGDNYVWLMNGTQIANRYVLNRVASSDWTIAGVGDLNGDGTDDIIWRNQNDGRNWAYLMNGGQIQTSSLINTVGNTNWQIADISDLNGDGKADLFWRQAQTGQSYIYLMDGMNISSSGYSNTVGASWTAVH